MLLTSVYLRTKKIQEESKKEGKKSEFLPTFEACLKDLGIARLQLLLKLYYLPENLMDMRNVVGEQKIKDLCASELRVLEINNTYLSNLDIDYSKEDLEFISGYVTIPNKEAGL